MIDQIRKIDARAPLTAKLDPLHREVAGIIKTRWRDMLPQTRRALESASASIEAAIAAERAEAIRKGAARPPIGPNAYDRVWGWPQAID